MSITQTISQFPPAPESTDDSATFNTKADAFVKHQADVFTFEANTWATQANSLKDTLNNTAMDAQSHATASATSATESAQSAGASQTSADDSEYYAQLSANYANFLGTWINNQNYTQPASILYGNVVYSLLVPTSQNDQPDINPSVWVAQDSVLNKVDKTGDTMTGALNVPAGASGTQVPQMQEVVSINNGKVNRSGDAMTGALEAPAMTIGGKPVPKDDGRGGVATAWALVDCINGVILESYNLTLLAVSQDTYSLEFDTPMDNANYAVNATVRAGGTGELVKISGGNPPTVNRFDAYTFNRSDGLHGQAVTLHIVVFGGKNA